MHFIIDIQSTAERISMGMQMISVEMHSHTIAIPDTIAIRQQKKKKKKKHNLKSEQLYLSLHDYEHYSVTHSLSITSHILARV